jgi:hypothetical protein
MENRMCGEKLDNLIHEIEQDLGKNVQLRTQAPAFPDDLPLPLQCLYKKCNGGNLLFGSLFNLDELEDTSRADPFYPDWIAFGECGAVFWLCARKPSAGLWFTSWDYDSDTDIDGAVFSVLSTFLRCEYERKIEQRTNGVYLTINSIPPKAKLATVSELKKFVTIGSMELVRTLTNLPLEIAIPNGLIAKKVAEKLRTLDVITHLRIDFL